jgi:hypothetical protein
MLFNGVILTAEANIASNEVGSVMSRQGFGRQ